MHSELEAMSQTKLRQTRLYHGALSDRTKTELHVPHWLPELLPVRSSCIVKTGLFSQREAQLFDLINKILTHHFKRKFISRASEIFTEANYLIWVECWTLKESSVLQLQKQLIFKKKLILRKGILNAE